MTDNHNYSFFGQTTGLIVSSSSKEDAFIFFKCIKKKSDGTWEKQSKGEGKIIKCSLEEIIMMLQVFNKKIPNWSSYHTFKDIQTQISFSWENGAGHRMWINIGNYSKMLTLAQVELFRLLLKHILKEKIKYATNSQFREKSVVSKPVETQTHNLVETRTHNPFEVKNTPNKSNSQSSENAKQIEGSIKGETEKALLINFNEEQEIWVPKSTIHSQYVLKRERNQLFLIDNWILKRNKILC